MSNNFAHGQKMTILSLLESCDAVQQSGGTSLSTNWKEVATQQYECKPPEGVKVKKFEQ